MAIQMYFYDQDFFADTFLSQMQFSEVFFHFLAGTPFVPMAQTDLSLFAKMIWKIDWKVLRSLNG